MPKLYKSHSWSRDALFDAVPGLALAETLLESSRDQMFCIKDGQLRYVSVNAAFVARSRKSNKAAVLGRTAGELFPPLLAAGYEQQDDVVLSAGQTFRDKLELGTNGDGTHGWYLTQKAPVVAGGRVVAIVSVSADLHMPAADDPRLAGLAGAVERIQQDYGSPLRVEQLARAARLSIGQFERRMYAVLRVSPRQLLTQTRVEAAARLLRETGQPLHRIAGECGFYDQAQFCRQFRGATGLTPGQYRKSAATPRRK